MNSRWTHLKKWWCINLQSFIFTWGWQNQPWGYFTFLPGHRHKSKHQIRAMKSQLSTPSYSILSKRRSRASSKDMNTARTDLTRELQVLHSSNQRCFSHLQGSCEERGWKLAIAGNLGKIPNSFYAGNVPKKTNPFIQLTGAVILQPTQDRPECIPWDRTTKWTLAKETQRYSETIKAIPFLIILFLSASLAFTFSWWNLFSLQANANSHQFLIWSRLEDFKYWDMWSCLSLTPVSLQWSNMGRAASCFFVGLFTVS